MDNASDGPDEGLLDRLGMTEYDRAVELADLSLRLVWEAGKSAVAQFDEPGQPVFVVLGLIARAQGFHEGAIQSIRAGNPHAAFTLLRAYAENAAAVAYLVDHPSELSRFFGGGHYVSAGKLVANAAEHAPGLKRVYDTLSEYAHPGSRGVIASHRVEDLQGGDVRFGWQSEPRFKSEGDRLLACAWTYELAEGHATLIEKLGNALAPKKA